MFHAEEPGRPLNIYVCYASTDKTPEMLYNYEPWRQEKLRKLKAEYDPKNKFRFYDPIIRRFDKGYPSSPALIEGMVGVDNSVN